MLGEHSTRQLSNLWEADEFTCFLYGNTLQGGFPIYGKPTSSRVSFMETLYKAAFQFMGSRRV